MSENCSHPKGQCLDSRPLDGYRRRRYRCLDCQELYTTMEVQVEMKKGLGTNGGLKTLQIQYGLNKQQQKAVEDMVDAFRGTV